MNYAALEAGEVSAPSAPLQGRVGRFSSGRPNWVNLHPGRERAVRPLNGSRWYSVSVRQVRAAADHGPPVLGYLIWSVRRSSPSRRRPLPDLRGIWGTRIYREMSQNDPVIGAILFSISMLVR